MFIKTKRFFEIGQNLAPYLNKNVLQNPDALLSLYTKTDQMKGPFLKISQFLPIIPGVLPESVRKQLLEKKATPVLDEDDVKLLLSKEIGPDWKRHIKKIDGKPFGVGSFGQVHSAVTVDNQNVAIKVQYPDIDIKLEADIDSLSLASKNAFQELIEEIKDTLFDEVDYKKELANIKKFQTVFKDDEQIKVVKPFEKFCSKRVLTTQLAVGKSIYDFASSDNETKIKISLHLLYAYYFPFFKHGIIHGDAHPTNYLFDDQLNLQLLDFGCVKTLKKEFIEEIKKTYQALLKQDDQILKISFKNLGFMGDFESLKYFAKMLFQPFLINDVVEIEIPKISALMVKKEGLKIPKEILIFNRVTVSIYSVLSEIKVRMNFHNVLNMILSS